MTGGVDGASESIGSWSPFRCRVFDLADTGAELAYKHPLRHACNTLIGRQSPVHILLVEDHHDSRALLGRLLNRWGHQVTSASSVHDALELMKQQHFDALVSDIGLPDGSGLELAAEGRRRQCFRRTVAVSALATDHDCERGRAAGFDHYLTKPLQFTTLQTALGEAI